MALPKMLCLSIGDTHGMKILVFGFGVRRKKKAHKLSATVAATAVAMATTVAVVEGEAVVVINTAIPTTPPSSSNSKLTCLGVTDCQLVVLVWFRGEFRKCLTLPSNLNLMVVI